MTRRPRGPRPPAPPPLPRDVRAPAGRGTPPPAQTDPAVPAAPATPSSLEHGEETILTVAELTIPGLIDGGAVNEAGPEALTMPGELVEPQRPVRLDGDRYVPLRTAPGAADPGAGPPGGDGPTTAPPLPRSGAPAGSRTETVHLSHVPPEKDTGSLTGARRPRKDRRGLQALLFANKDRGPTRRASSLGATLTVLALLCAVLGAGTLLGRWARKGREERLLARAEAASERARRSGRLPELLDAAGRHGEVLAHAPAYGPALRARALLLAEALYELGGPTTAAAATEAEAAVRLVQGDGEPEAQAAQAYLLLAAGAAEAAAPRVAALGGAPEGGYLAGQLALLRGDDEEALRQVARATAQRPERTLWQLRLAQLLLRLGRGQEAAEATAAALRESPEHLLGRVLKGCQGPAAEQTLPPLLQDAERSRTEEGEGWLCLAERALGKVPPDLAEAKRLLVRARAAVPPGSVLQRERLATALLGAGERAHAEAEAEALRRHAPGRPAAHLTLAQALLRRGQGQEALELLQPRGQPWARSPEAELLRARALLLLDETLEAQGLARVHAAGPRRAEAVLLLTQVALRQGEHEEARRLLRGLQGMELAAGQQHEGERLQAELWLQTGERERARSQLQDLVRRAPQHGEAQLLLARLLRDDGQRAAARQVLLASLGVEDRPAARRALGQILLEDGDGRLARQQYEPLVSGDGEAETDGALLLEAARAFRLGGDAARALGLLGRLRAGRDGGGEDALLEEGRALLQLGRAEEALRLLGESARTTRRAAPVALRLRALLAVPGGIDRARRLLAALPPALRHDPAIQVVEARLLLDGGQPREAELLLRAVLPRLSPGELRDEALELLGRARR